MDGMDGMDVMDKMDKMDVMDKMDKEPMPSTSKSDYFFSVIAALLPAAMGFLFFPFYAKALGPTAYGTVALMECCQSIAAIILLMGMTTSFYTFYGHATSDVERKKVLTSALIYGCLLLLMVLFVVLPAIPFISPKLFHGANISDVYLQMFAFSIFSDYLQVIVSNWLRLEGRIRLMAANMLMLCCMQHALSCCAIWGIKAGLDGFIGAFFISKLISVSVSIFRIRGALTSGLTISYRTLWEMMRFGMPLILTALTGWILLLSDRFFIEAYGSLSDIGIYAVTYKLSSSVTIALVHPFVGVWEPSLIRLYAENRNSAYDKLRSDFNIYFAFVIFIFTLQLMFMADFMAIFFSGSKYLQGASLFPFMIGTQLLMATGEMWGTVCRLNKTSKFALAVTLIAVGMKIILNVVLIPKYMLIGLATASLMAEVCSQSVMAYYAHALSRGRNLFLSKENILLFALFTLIMCLMVLVHVPLLMKVFIAIAIGLVCYKRALERLALEPAKAVEVT